jgi:hypothetical protein
MQVIPPFILLTQLGNRRKPRESLNFIPGILQFDGQSCGMWLEDLFRFIVLPEGTHRPFL